LLHVNGAVAGVGAYNQLSDERYKKDIDDISDSLTATPGVGVAPVA
jgi:hypothetical protein